MIVFVLAKASILVGRDVPLSGWAACAYVWQDLFVAGLIGLLDFAVRRAWFGWGLYGASTLYVAVNVPIARVLSTPLTWTMLRGVRGTLADSILHYVTVENVLVMLLVIAVAAICPWQLRRVPLRILAGCGAGALSLLVLGPLATQRVETVGLHRNALAALVGTAFPRVTSQAAVADWRRSPFPAPPTSQLAQYRGSAAGRNVIVVILESAGARYLRDYGAAEDPMPNLTTLAQHAVVFDNAYAVYPESIKGLFSVLCSRFPAIDTDPKLYERVPCAPLATVLAAAGYRTALFHSGRFMYLGMESVVQRRGFQTLEDAGQIGGEVNSSFGVDEPSAVKRIFSWIDALPRGQRFFVTYLPIAGHHPYVTPEPGPFPEPDELGRYRNALHYADEALGALVRGLRERGLDQESLLVVFGDHGEAFGQHAGNYGHTFFLYDENVRVPYVVAGPGLVQEQVRVQHVASLIDTAPTILDFLGLPAPAEHQGQSLLDGKPRLALFFTDYSLAFVGLRDGQWKFIHELESGRSKLFDLATDPDETRDLSVQQPERVAAYRNHLERWAAAQRTLIRASH